MWVFLETPEGTQLICDIGGVHQAAGEYVDLWDYIQKPTEGNTINDSTTEENTVSLTKYKLKFFYTERGAAGSTCWMQFTLPSVNAVPVVDYTGNVKSTLTVNKQLSDTSTPTNERFDFKVVFSGTASNVDKNKYPYQILEKDQNGEDKIIESGDIRSNGPFKLGHNQTIVIYNIPDGTHYTIEEAEPNYDLEVGSGSTGTIVKDQTVGGDIDWDNDDKLNLINREVEYELPETGGYGPIIYTMASVLVILTGAGFMYRKKVRERRV